MRHGKKFNHLGRKSAHRKAMLANMASSLIMHKRINTTLAKAKALRKFVEPLITKSKDDSTQSRRVVFSYLRDKNAVSELYREVALKIADRPGGYTRILKTGNRLGDNAEMCLIELVDYNENRISQPKKVAKKTRRRKSTAKKKEVVASESSVAENVKSEVKAEVKSKTKSAPKAEKKVKETPKKESESDKKTEK
jgi:large subunit ribosomal protein L17